MPAAVTFIEVLAGVAVVIAFAGDWLGLPTARAFTLTELIAFGLALVVVAGLLMAGRDIWLKTKTEIKGVWLNTPNQIPAAPQSGVFVYHVFKRNLKGTKLGDVAGHKVLFTLTQVGPSGGSIIIESVTDMAGNTIAAGGLTATGTTDAKGRITVMVQFEQFRSGMITAADAATGESDPTDSFAMTAY